jgi:uncharacterized protein (AIM24 family)
MKSSLFNDNTAEVQSSDIFMLQNDYMLKVNLNGEILARQGSMVGYQGTIDFDHKGSGVSRWLKKSFTGEGLPLMKVTGQGDVFFAHAANLVHIIKLENESIVVNGSNILAFESSLQWDVTMMRNISAIAGGLFNTKFTGTGLLAIISDGTPAVLKTDGPTFADANAAIAWSSEVSANLHSSLKTKAFFGFGSGEAFQLKFDGNGFVIIQPSEGISAAPR